MTLRAVCPVDREASKPDGQMGVLWLWWMRHRASHSAGHPLEPTFEPVPEYTDS